METQDNVRVYDYVSQMVIKPHDESFYDYGFDYMLTYFDDPRASFPSPAYNWMASRGVPEFVETLHQAALKLFTTKQRNLVVNRANNSSDCVWLKPKDRNDFVVNASSENTEQSSEPQSDPTADSPVNPAENQPDENESREPLYRRFKTLHNWNWRCVWWSFFTHIYSFRHVIIFYHVQIKTITFCWQLDGIEIEHLEYVAIQSVCVQVKLFQNIRYEQIWFKDFLVSIVDLLKYQ